MAAVGVHVARVGLFTTDANGVRINKNSNSTTINQLKNTKQEFLIIPDLGSAPNSAGYPTIGDYLQLEGLNGFKVEHLDQSYCVTIPAAAPVVIDPVSYTYTGTLTVAPVIVLSTPTPIQVASSVADYSRKWASTIVLSAANLSLTSISFTDLQGMSGSFAPSGLSVLSSLNFPVLTTVGVSFSPTTLAALTSLSLPALTTVGSSFNPSSMAALTSLSLPALTTVGSSFNPSSMAALTSLSAPALTTVGSSFNPSSMAALTSLSAPALTTVGGNFNPNNMNVLTSLSAPALTTVGGTLSPSIMGTLASISIPVIERIGTTVTSGSVISIISITPALSTFQLPSTLKQIGSGAGNVVITSAALNQASVDNILVRLAALNGSNGTTAFSSRVVTITGTSSTPSATGLAAKATLVARGCTVTNN